MRKAILPKPTLLNTDNIKQLANKTIVIEELIDADGVALSFDAKANISIELLDTLDPKPFEPLYEFGHKNADTIFDLLYDRYILVGKWCSIKKTVHYDHLCSLFIESDVFDKQEECWLSMPKRHALISKHASKLICSAPLIKIGKFIKDENKEWDTLHSFYKTDEWKDKLQTYCERYKLGFENVMNETDNTAYVKGLYIKHEDENRVIDRYVYMRNDFVECENAFNIPNVVAKDV